MNDCQLCVCLTALWAFGKPRARGHNKTKCKKAKKRDLMAA